MFQNKRRFLIGVAILLFVLTFGLTYQKFSPFPLPSREDPLSSETLLAEGAEVVTHYLLSDGIVAKTEVGSVAGELIGKGMVDVQAIHPNWKIVSFSSNRLVVNEFCPDEEYSGGFVRATEGRVGIYAGEMTGCHRLIELTNILVEPLSERTRTSLREGIEFRDHEDLPQLLDGLEDTA